MTRPPNLVYGVDDRPPPLRLLALGLQYAVLMSVYLVLVALVARAAGASTETARNLVSFGLVALAVAASLQAFRGRHVGSGFLAPPSFSAIYFAPSLLAAQQGGLPAVAAMTIFAGLVEIVLSRLVRRLRIVFQPLISGFTVLLVGIQLGLVAAQHLLDVGEVGRAGFGWSVGVGCLTLAVGVGLSVWGRGVWRLISTLLALAAGTGLALLVGVVGAPEIAAVTAAPWVAIPDPSFIAYRFDWTLAPVFLAAGVAAAIRTVGVVTACQRLNDADWKRPEPESIRRGMAADGLGAVVSGLLGVNGTSAAPSMVGISGATGATSRVIAYAAAAILLVFALTPKLSAGVLALPVEVAGGILLFSATLMIASGIQIMALHGLDVRRGFAVAAALLFGLTAQVDPGYFARLPAPLDTITGDLLTFSLAVAIALILLFRLGLRRAETIQWRTADTALADFHGLLAREGKAWSLDADLVGRADKAVETVIDGLKAGGLLEDAVLIRSSYDDLELQVEIAYRGRAPVLGAHAPLRDAHEETAVAAGLRSFAVGEVADRSGVTVNHDRVTVRLWFAR